MKVESLFSFDEAKKVAPKLKREFNVLRKHTQEKLKVYTTYLNVYLEVLSRTSSPSTPVYINICDMFAGQGDYDGKSGSANSAIDMIKKFQKGIKGKNVHISLYLNDKEEKCYKSLSKTIQYTKSSNWASCTHMDANSAIKNIMNSMNEKQKGLSGQARLHNLFYLDPFGYTQLDKSSIDTIIGDGKTRNECILFVPVTHIARFVKQDLPISEQEPSIAKFLEEYKIPPQDAGWNTCGKSIKAAFARTYNSSYVGSAKLRASGANHYVLYFIGNHIYGLDKFLEAVERVQNEGRVAKYAAPFAPFKSLEEGHPLSIKNYLSEPRNNCELYEHALKSGWSRSLAQKTLKTLEKREHISVDTLPTLTKNRRDSFYLHYKDFKDKPKIRVQAIPKELF